MPSFRYLSTARLPASQLSNGVVPHHFVSQNVESMVQSITGIPGFSLANARTISYVAQQWNNMKTTWLSQDEATGLNAVLRKGTDDAALGPLNMAAMVTTPAMLRSAILDSLNASQPGRFPGSDVRSYLSGLTADKISPCSMKFLFIVIREVFIFQSMADTVSLREPPTSLTQGLPSGSAFAIIFLQFVKAAYPYGFDIAKPTPTTSSTGLPPSPPPQRRRAETPSFLDTSMAGRSLSGDPVVLSMHENSALGNVLSTHGSLVQVLGGLAVLQGVEELLKRTTIVPDLKHLLPMLISLFQLYRFRPGGDTFAEQEVSAAKAVFDRQQLDSPGQFGKNPAEVLGFIEDYLPSAAINQADRLFNVLTKHKKRTALSRSFSSASDYTGNSASDDAIDVAKRLNDKLNDRIRNLERKRKDTDRYDKDRREKDRKDRDRDRNRDRNRDADRDRDRDRNDRDRPFIPPSPIIGKMVDMLRPKMPSVDVREVRVRAVRLLDGRCAVCNKKFDYRKPCCSAGSLHPDVIKKIQHYKP